MAPILNKKKESQVFLFADDFYEDFEENQEDKAEEVSQWIKAGDTYRPSINLELCHKLPPGMYSVESSNQIGYYCKRIDTNSDGLIKISNKMFDGVINEIDVFMNKADLYKQNKIVHKRGILLEGYPGTGKSSLISLLSKTIISKGGVVFMVNSINDLNLYIDFIKYNFRVIEKDTPIITIIEDLDRYVQHDMILDFLDGKLNIDHHIVLCTTNNSSNIPDTFLRPSRIDLRVEIPLPDKSARKQYFSNRDLEESEIEEFVSSSEGMSMADLKELYIATKVLGYTIKESALKITHPNNKKNYLSFDKKAKNLGLH